MYYVSCSFVLADCFEVYNNINFLKNDRPARPPRIRDVVGRRTAKAQYYNIMHTFLIVTK